MGVLDIRRDDDIDTHIEQVLGMCPQVSRQILTDITNVVCRC